MKLAEMNGDQLMGAMIRIARPMERISGDEKLYTMISEYRNRVNKTRVPVVASVELYAKIASFLLSDEHKADTVAILVEVTGQPAELIGKMNGMQIFREALIAWKKDLRPFFTLFKRGELIE